MVRLRIGSSTLRTILLTVVITVVITIITIAIITRFSFSIAKTVAINNVVSKIATMCHNETIEYRHPVFVPQDSKLYNRDLAVALWDISGAVSTSNCKDSIPMPPTFVNKEIVIGYDPDIGHTRMYANVFWNDNSACIAFTGTYDKNQWNDNFNINQTVVTDLNNLRDGTRIHGGFHNVYLSVRKNLWDWWYRINGLTVPPPNTKINNVRPIGVRLSPGESIGLKDPTLQTNTNLNSIGPSNGTALKIKTLYITGRSLGGALSTICAFDFSGAVPDNNLIHYSFAAPRVGNVTFAETFNTIVTNSVRIYNTEDIVVNLPPSVWFRNDYMHTGNSHKNKSFTKNLGSFIDNHIEAYRDMPD